MVLTYVIDRINLSQMKTKLFSVCIVLLFPPSLFAWGGDGHQIVCLIAEDHLSPAAKAGIHDLLGADVNISDAEIASWADNIRRERRNTASLHFVDIPVAAPGFDEFRDGKHGNNVVEKTIHFQAVLSDQQGSKEKRAEALKFLVHFVGDLHQPLHCADRNDKGGNSRLVSFLDQPRALNLHTVWDTTILLRRNPMQTLTFGINGKQHGCNVALAEVGEELHEQFHLAVNRLRQKTWLVHSFFSQAGLKL